MNRNYKVVWNRSLGCFTAVAEYAKARGKSSSSAVSSNSATSEAISSGAKLLRLTAICAGLAASGFSMQAMAVDGDFDNVTANGDVTASGTVNANGGLTVAGGQTVNMGNNKVTNVANGTATKDAVNFGQLEAVKTTANQGFNIKANSGAEQKIGPGETVTFQDGDSNIKITRTGNTISIATSPDQNFATVTTTGNTNVGGMLNANGGLTVAGGQTVNMGNNKVTNVANGTTTNDAVNFGQLDAVKTTANRGWDIQANGGAKQTIATGDTVNFTNGNNIVISRNGNAISVATSPNPNFTTVTTTGNVTVGGLTVTSNKTVNMGNNKVTNVANGTIAENGKDAATTGQLWKLTDGGDGVKYFHANSEQPDSEAIGQESIAIGPNTKSEGVSSLAAGDSASVTAQGEGAIALGQNATAGGAALGSGGAGAVAVGRDSVATGGSATALGDDAQASGGNATALGKGANASGGNSIALGRSTASSGNAFAAGNGAEAKSPDGISIGTGAGVGTTGTVGSDRRDNIAIGRKSGQNVIAKESIGIGFDAGSNVEGDNNTAIGTQAGMGITGEYNISMGYQANKNAGVLDHSTVVGSKANAGSNSVALGYEAQANNTDAVAVGSNAISNAQGLALGANSKSEGNNIALGFNSKALDSDSTNSSYLTGNVSGQGVVSVGSTSANITRRIVNVADGANGTDAVNVNQLKGAQQSVANLVGGGVPLNLDGSYGKITVNKVGGGTEEFDTVVDAIGAITSGSVSVLPPEAAKYNSDGTLDVAAGTLDGQAVNLGQLNTAIAENGIQYFSVNSTEGANRNNDGASGTNTIAIGPEASASGDESLALGYKARSDADVSIAIGNNVRAEGKRSTVLGNESRVYDANGVAIGYEAVSNGENSLVMGTGAESNEKITGERVDNAIVIGTKARSTASDDGIAIGRTALAKEDRAVAQGFNAESTADDAMAFGSRSRASGTSSQASGTDANASATNAQASGTNASASGFNAIAQGTRATGYATDGIAMGTGATSGFEDPNNQDPQRNTAGIAIGKNSLADEQNALALGVEAKARAKSATAVGDGARATDINALAMGTGAAASKQDATAIGREATANAQDATAFGRGAAASAQDAIAFGRGAQAREQGAMALGQGAKANTNDNDVALGAGSVTGAVVNTPNATIDKNKYTYAGTNAASTVSVGTAGNERTVTNVAAGRVSANSTDAINGSQLYGTNQAVTALGNNLDTAGQSVATALGGNSSYNPANHTVSANLNVNGTNYTNVESAIKYAAQGWNVQTNGDTTSNVAPGSTVQLKDGKNIKITRNGKDITVATADDVTFTKVTSGSMTVNNTDSTANGGTKNYVTQGSTSVVNGGDVYTAINTTNQQYQGDNGAVVTRNPNQVLKVKGGATTGTENNIQTVSNAADGSISVKLAEKIDLGTDGRVKIGSTTINNSGLSITGGPSITAAGINAGGKVITDVASGVGNDNNAANIGDLNRAAAAAKTEVAAGTNVAGVTKSTGGNGQDIYTVNAKGASTTAGSSAVTVTNTTDASTNVTNAAVDLSAASKASLAKADNSVQYDNAGKTSVTLGGAGASPVTITNVADGTLSTSSKDAVNGSQLHATNQNVATNKDNITNNTNAIAQGFNIGADNGADDNVQLGEKVDFNGDGNLITTVSNNAIGVSLADSITVGSTNPVTIDGNTGTLSGLTNQTISGANFADGSGRAATEEQLSAVNTTANKGWNVKVNDTASDNVAPG
ncbi:ESPR-type extended signal peptide-containing protein, partial [Psychrobacter sp. 1Y11]|uniref:ESPR-type extended signal peptide-containing protein n=1 Tax=Psychrobacter sp. 1Y11 TaxID=3457446 RepID=UPI003FCEF670